MLLPRQWRSTGRLEIFYYNTYYEVAKLEKGGISTMVVYQLPKLGTRVRFPYPAQSGDDKQAGDAGSLPTGRQGFPYLAPKKLLTIIAQSVIVW